MCGRFFIDYEFRDIIEKYNLAKYKGSIQKGEIFPSQKVLTIVEKYAIAMNWGFDFKWSKRRIINARSETIFDKKTFKKLINQKRCIIPASAYYEWQKKDDQKIKHEIFSESERIISLAGLYNVMIDKNNQKIYQFTILTKEANKNIREIHHRMPVIITAEDTEEWLFSKSINETRVIEMMKNQGVQLKAKIV